MKHPHTQKIQIVTRIRSETALPKNLRLVESRHFPAFFSFVSIDPESAIMFHIVCHRRNSIGFRAHKNNRKQITFVSSSVLFGTGFYFFNFRYFMIVLGFHTRDKNNEKTARNSPRTAVKSNFSLHKNTYTHTTKKGDSHTQENKRQHQQNESILRARNKMVLFFSF